MNFKVEVYKTTTDDFHPNFNENQVLITYQGNISPPGQVPQYRVTVQGNDDFRLVYDTVHIVDAQDMFTSIIFLDDVTISNLLNLGLRVF